MKVLRGLLKFLGYSAFFLVALVFFVYLTLPLGEVEDYLVRKAADEFNADLTFNDEDSLDTCGLTCIEAKNVTVKFRASPEDQAAFSAKNKIYIDWRKAQREAAQGKTGEGKTGAGSKADAPASGAGKKTGANDDASAKGDGTDAKVDSKNAIERPENPSKTVEVDRLKLSAELFKLIGGAIDGTLEADLIGGTIEAAIVQGEDEFALEATVSDLDASKLDVLRTLIDLPIVGTLSSEIDLTLPVATDDSGKKTPDLTALSGTLGLSLANVAVGPGQIKTKSKTGFPFFDVPKTRINRLGGQVVFARKRATFENFKISGKDLEGELTGYATLMPKLDDWRLNAHLNLKFSDAFTADNRDVKIAMSSSPYLRKGQSDGYTGFNIHGTVGNVKFRPRKKSSSAGSRGRKPKRASKRSRTRKKKSGIDRKGRSTKKRPTPRTTTKRPSAKRSTTGTEARVASPMVRKGRSTADEPEPEDDEPEDDEPEDDESDEPEGDEEDDEGSGKDTKGDDDEEGDGDEKPDDDDKEE